MMLHFVGIISAVVCFATRLVMIESDPACRSLPWPWPQSTSSPADEGTIFSDDADQHVDDAQLKDFNAFWRVVDLNEGYIRQYGHVGWHPGLRDGWDEQFERVYEAIHRHLAPLQRHLTILTPSGAMGFNPYEAETSHQGLMFFLNPPENLFGQAWILSSPEYVRLKGEAMAEMDRLLTPSSQSEQSGHRPLPNRKPARRTRKKTQRGNDELLLRELLLTQHFPYQADTVLDPFIQDEIAQVLGWGQPRVSRAIRALFGPGGMKVYKSQLASSQLKGFLKRGDDGMTDVEAFDED